MSFIQKLGAIVKEHVRVFLVFLDIISVGSAVFFSTLLKYDAVIRLPQWFKEYAWYVISIDLVVMIALFVITKVYKRMWQYFVSGDYAKLGIAFLVSKLITFFASTFVWIDAPRSFFTWFALYVTIQLFLILVARFIIFIGYNFWRLRVIAEKPSEDFRKKRVMIVGAGNGAKRLIDELHGSKNINRYKIVALIDDNHIKHNSYLYGIKVYGGRDQIIKTAKDLDVDEIFYSIASANEKSKKEILEICNKTGCVLKILPAVSDLNLNKKAEVKLRKVDYTDLLGREQIKPDLSKVFELLKGHTVLVTGGGGSIGSELVRQIANSGVAKRIIIFDVAENGAYDIQQEIRRKYPDVDLKVLIGSVRDENRLCEIFEEYKPSFVYHAAAHKHVPLMEDSPKEAVKNNVFGTYNLAKTADKYGVKRFVMISTDKAVNPTNVMGATKRICEMIVQSFNKISKTDFVAVRFGNVLGSNGSVIPLFKAQIENGGPVTVTHPDIIRYFMLIPEAVSLVLQAGAYAQGGEIFILDMGSPVKIRELAENLIRLSGHVPGEDIEIRYTGLRDGEKLYEELLISEEGIQKTQNDLIYVARPMDFDSEALFKKLDVLKSMLEGSSHKEIVDVIRELVPTFVPNNASFVDSSDADKKDEEVCV